MDVNFPDLGLGNDFWAMTQKTESTKEKRISKFDIIKFKSFGALKDTIKKVKR